ncbi:MAG: CvpA family protein [Clostridia bacterium]|nr:CvpA family protein [Clostridia bacterium]
MSIILDLVVVAIFIVFICIGIKNGFIKTLVSLLGFVIALVLALIIANKGAFAIYDGLIADIVKNGVNNALSSTVGNDVESIVMNIPEFFLDAAKALGYDINEIVMGNLGETVELTAEAVANVVSRDIARPIIGNIIRIVLFLISFFVIRLLIGWIGGILNIVEKIPVLRNFNKLLGGVLGAIKGLLVVYFICYLVVLLAGMSVDGVLGISFSTIEDTKLFSIFAVDFM